MVKINFNIPGAAKAFKDNKKNITKGASVKINNKTYLVSRVDKTNRGYWEVVGRRILGGFLTTITLGLVLLNKASHRSFRKNKNEERDFNFGSL